MKGLSWKAKVYILSSILVGAGLTLWSLFHVDWREVWMMLILSIVASLALIFKVIGSTDRSHYNISFLVYAFAFILLGPEATLMIVIISNLVEWAWHKYPWYIQAFNISTYIIGFSLAGIVFQYFSPEFQVFGLSGVVGALASMLVFTLVNHLMIGMVIWLARGENFTQSGVFEFFPLMLDFILLCMGVVAALVWLVIPVGIIFVLLPLYLIYSTLRVPALERKTEIDAKTGLFNVEYFNKNLKVELERANRFDRPLTIVMADLDLLRNINNTYGHLAGDEVLIGVANIFKENVREYDIVARFGGEEYAILMQEITPEQAYDRIDSLRQKIEAAEFSVPTSVTPIKATMSFGISGRDCSDISPRDIIHNADTALYHAKLKGRNGTFIYSEDGVVDLFNQDMIEYLHPEEVEQLASQFNETHPLPPVPESEDIPQAETKQPVNKMNGNNDRRTSGVSQPLWVVYAFIAAMAFTAMTMFTLNFKPNRDLDWIGLFVFAIMVLLTEWYSVDIYVRDSAVSTSAVPMLAGILIYGPLGALCLSLVFALVAWYKHRSPINRLVFNFSNQMIAGMLYTVLIGLLGVPFIELEPGIQVLICIASMGIVYLSTTLMIAFGMSLDVGLPYKTIWKEKFRWLAPIYIAMGLIAYTLVFSYSTAGFLGILAVLVPLLVLRMSQKQYIDKTKIMVAELKDKNVALEQSACEINKLNEGLLDTLAEVVDLRDPYVLGHSKQVARYAVLIARRMGMSRKRIDLLRKAALLHDIGKLGIPESILFKPTKLMPEEYEKIKKHVNLGADILQTSHALKDLIPIVRYHHEYYDGNGYPEGLKGEEIPVEARILSVADAVEAMGSDRPYRSGLNQDEILAELKRQSGTQFDPKVVRAFQSLIASETDPVVINFSRALRPSKLEPVEAEYSPVPGD